MSGPTIYTKRIEGATTYNPTKILRTMHDDAKAFAESMVQPFLPSVKTWGKQPVFESFLEVIPGGSFLMTAGTSNPIYEMVNDGTKSHFITPRRAKVLAFPRTFRAKTSPGILRSKAGFKSKKLYFSKGHMVSGIEPRRFDEAVVKIVEKQLPKAVEQSIARALAGSVVAQGA